MKVFEGGPRSSAVRTEGGQDVAATGPVSAAATESTATAPLTATAVRDLELVLLGILPRTHVLGAAVQPAGQPPADDATTGLADVDPVLVNGTTRLVLVDEEQTPLAALEVPSPSGHGVTGRLVPLRRRESGPGRDRAVDAHDLTAPWHEVVVLARPMLPGEEPAGAGPGLLLLVPDEPSGTDGIPVTTMLTLADNLALRLGGATVRTVPLSWRDPESDAALVDALGAAFTRTAHGVRVLRANDGTTAAARWAGLRNRLEGAAGDGAALADGALAPEDGAVLESWRPPRSRRGLVIVFTGLSGSGKSTVARALARRITEETPRTVSLLDGDVVRRLVSSGLGFDRESRLINLRRIGWIAAEVARHGGIAVCAPIAPYAGIRQEMRTMAEATGDFVLVHVSTPLEECERRDLKGLYAKARAGLITEFTGISDPYDVPEDADVAIDTSTLTIAEATAAVCDHLVAGGWLEGSPHAH